MPEVEVDGKGVFEFPEGISPEEMQGAIDSHLEQPIEPGTIKPNVYEAARAAGQPSGMEPGTEFTKSLFIKAPRDIGQGLEKAWQPVEQFGAVVLNMMRLSTAPQASLTTGQPITAPPAAPPFKPGVSPLTPYLPLAATSEKGVVPELSRGLLSLTTPGSIISAPFIPESRLLQAAFAGQAAASIPEAIEQIAQAETPQESQGALTSLLLRTGMTGLMGRGATRKRIPNASRIRETETLHGNVRSQETTTEGLSTQERGSGIQPQAAPGESGQARLLLSPEDQAYLDAEAKGIDVPVEIVPQETSENQAFAKGDIATIDRAKGTIRINPESYSAWLREDVPPDKRAEATRSLLGEERFHLAVDDASAQAYRENQSAPERIISDRIYSGSWRGLNPATGEPISPLLLAHEALRRHMQHAARMTPREFFETSTRERWTVKTLDVLERAIRKTRETLGTKASKEQQAIVDRMLGNVTAARVAMNSAEPGAIRKEKEKDADRLGVITDEDGRHHLPITIKRSDGTTYQAQFNGYYDLREMNGGTPESIGRQLETGNWTHGGLHAGEEILTKVPEIDAWNALFEPKKKPVYAPTEAAAIRKKKGEAQMELYLPPLAKGVQTERPGATDLGSPKAPPTPQGATIQPQDLAHDANSIRPAFNEITPDEAKNLKALSGILTDDAREFRKPVSETKRVTVMENKKTGAVEALSTYRDPRRGAVVLDPDTGRHVPLGKALQTYRPVASLLLKDPVKNFRQKFNNLQEFESQFAEPAREGASTAYQEPPAALEAVTELRASGGTTGKAAVPGQFQPQAGTFETGETVPLTDAEAGAVRDHIINEVGTFDTPDDVKASLAALSEGVDRKALSGYRKLYKQIERENPNLSHEETLERLAQSVYEDHQRSASKEDFISRTMAKSVAERSEAPPGGFSASDVQTPGAIRKHKDAAKEKIEISTRLISAAIKRRSVIADIPRVLDGTENAGRQYSQQAGNAIRLASGEDISAKGSNIPLTGKRWRERRAMQEEALKRRKAAIAFVTSGFTKDTPKGKIWLPNRKELGTFETFLASARGKAALMVQDNNPFRKRAGKKWQKAIEEYQAGINYARAHWNDPEFRATAKEYQTQIKEAIDIENSHGSHITERQNYTPGVYEGEFWADNMITFAGRRLLGQQYRMKKSFKNPYEAINAGPYVLASQDIAALAEHRIRQGQQIIARKMWLNALQNLRDPDSGQPIGKEPLYSERDATDPLTGLLRKEGYWQSPSPEYDLVPTSFGVNAKPIAIRHAFTDVVKSCVAPSRLSEMTIKGWPIGRDMLMVTSALKHGVILLWDSFHPGRIGQYAASLLGASDLGFRGGQTALLYRAQDIPKAVSQGFISQKAADWALTPTAIKDAQGRQLTRQQIAHEMIRRGLNASKISDALYKDAVQNIPLIGEKYHKVVGPYNRWMFDKFIPGLIVESAVRNLEKFHQSHPNIPLPDLMKDVLTDVNAFYGNMGRQGIFRNATMRDLAQITFLAPLWQEGLFQKEARFLSRLTGLSYATGRRGLPYLGTLGEGMARGLAAYFIGTQMINLVTRGKLTFQNQEKDHKLDAWIPTGEEQGLWISPLSVFGEVTHDLIRLMENKPTVWDAIQQIGENRMGPFGRVEQILRTGNAPTGEKYSTTAGVLKGAAGQLLPAPISLATPARWLGHKLLPNQISRNPAGQLPRQLVGSLAGIRAQVSRSPSQQMFEMATKFVEKEGLKKTTGWTEQMTDEPSYSRLRTAVRNGDVKVAKQTMEALRKTHSDEKIYQAMVIWSKRPYTGNNEAEGYFKASLSNQEHELYTKAQEERQDVMNKFKDFVAGEKP